MNITFYIGTKLYSKHHSSSANINNIIRISTYSIAISILIMVLSICIVKGFQREIKEKVIQFDSHIRAGKFGFDQGTVSNPCILDSLFTKQLLKNNKISHIQPFIEKGGIIKTTNEVHGIFLKGLPQAYDQSFFERNLINGSPIKLSSNTLSPEIIISKTLSKLLNIQIGDQLKVFFIQEPIRVRVFKVVGMYHSGMDQFDASYVFCDLRVLQKLNGWDSTQVEGYEIFIRNLTHIEDVNLSVLRSSDYKLNTIKINDKHPEIFGWLDLLDLNVQVILLFAILVSIINIIATLLIIVLDKTNFIALFKVIGASNMLIIKIFTWASLKIVFNAIVIGNSLALFLAFMQQKFSLIRLPQESYYLDAVPIAFSWDLILLVNIIAIFCSFLCIIIPSLIITKISPSKAIRFS